MKTDDVVRALVADRVTAPPVHVTLAAALLLGGAMSAALFAILLGPRDDVVVAVGDPRFLLKFVETIALAATAAGAVLALARPGRRPGRRLVALLVAPAILATVVAVELAIVSPAQWTAQAIGSNSMVCLINVPLLAAPVLVAALIALRGGAPTRPMLAGAVAGLMAGGLGATLYAAHCTDDSPLFVAVWYAIAIAGVAAVGALAGRLALRW